MECDGIGLLTSQNEEISKSQVPTVPSSHKVYQTGHAMITVLLHKNFVCDQNSNVYFSEV